MNDHEIIICSTVVEKTSVTMSDGEKRKAICLHCILVKGFRSDTSLSVIKSIFPELCRGELLARSASFVPLQKEWIVQFLSVNGIKTFYFYYYEIDF